MKKMRRTVLGMALLLFTSAFACAQGRQQVDPTQGPGLKDAYKDYFTIGVAVNQRNVT